MLALNLAVRIAAAVLNVPPDVLSFLPMIPPPPLSSPGEAARRKASSEALAFAYRPKDGFDAPEEDILLVDGSSPSGTMSAYEYDGFGPPDARPGSEGTEGVVEEKEEDYPPRRRRRPSTYGEITELGARQLFSYMGMTGRAADRPDRCLIDSDRDGDVVFFDLGSGAGRLVCQAYMELPRLTMSSGVEMAPSRHCAAERAWGELRGGDGRDGGDGAAAATATKTAKDVRTMGGVAADGASVKLTEGDLFDINVSRATHVYTASLCFTDDMMKRLRIKLEGECPRLRCVATLRAFPPQEKDDKEKERGEGAKGERQLGLARMEYVEMSWTKPRGEGCTVYFYDVPHGGRR